MSSVRARVLPHDPLAAAGRTDPGRLREVNEDRFHIDLARGIVLVIDGVGGHAAGGKAADVALARVRERLERETGPVADRIREAIAIANNEILRLAATRAEWEGMACVLTVAVVGDGRAVVGHVGDTRLYKFRDGRLEKITRDHSPVGEREDAQEISEIDAMRHPRRNEVYRDVGSDEHAPSDPEFIDIQEIAFEADAALLLCSDGLTDLVESAAIADAIVRFAGDADAVATALVAAANAAGGKDNVTVVYVEGPRFRPEPRARAIPAADDTATSAVMPARPSRLARAVQVGALVLVTAVIGLAVGRWFDWFALLQSAAIVSPAARTDLQVVDANSSIGAALARATAGSQIVVEPGEYREQLILREGVRVVSRVSGAASLRLPASAPDGAAVVASNLTSAEFSGFRIVGDAATPLGVGILADESALTIVDVEITGATRAAVEFAGRRSATLLASHLHGNQGAALLIRGQASPRIAHNTFSKNGVSEEAPGTLSIETGAAPLFRRNLFLGVTPAAAAALEHSTRLPLGADNWFVPPPPVPGPSAPPARSPRKR